MASYTNRKGDTYQFQDGQPDFPAWLGQDAQRQASWDQATVAYAQAIEQTGTDPVTSDCLVIFEQWRAAVGAVLS